MRALLRRLRGEEPWADVARTSDGQLLGAFIERRDEEAFARLVQRHGPMVLSVCRRLLGSVHDAEDAFQATFLILVRKARAIGRRELVGNWLYGVAYRTALEARAKNLRRMARQKPIADLAGPDAEAPLVARELQGLLDRELSRLPDKYRVPVVLCELEGRGRSEVAQQLHLPEGTLSSRLATARKLLAKRLARHGWALGAGMLATALAEEAIAGVPTALAHSTVRAALLLSTGNAAAASAMVSANVFALCEGVLKAMFLTKLKLTAAWLFVGLLSLGSAGLAYRVAAGEPAADRNDGTPVIAGPAQDAKKPGNDNPPAKDAKLRGLQQERLATLRQLVEQLTKMHDAGKLSFDHLHHAMRALLNAELEMSDSAKQRIDSLEKIVALAKRLEEEVGRKYKVGVVHPAEFLQARIARLEAEIALERAKSAAPAPRK